MSSGKDDFSRNTLAEPKLAREEEQGKLNLSTLISDSKGISDISYTNDMFPDTSFSVNCKSMYKVAVQLTDLTSPIDPSLPKPQS